MKMGVLCKIKKKWYPNLTQAGLDGCTYKGLYYMTEENSKEWIEQDKILSNINKECV